MIPEKVIPAFPYEGALYWLFSSYKEPLNEIGHPYYQSLFGVDADRIVSRASALACLFEEIIMAPANSELPEDSSLRVSSNRKYGEWDDEQRDIAEALLNRPAIQRLVADKPYFADGYGRLQFLCRTIAQMRMVSDNEAILLGNSFFGQLYNEIIKQVGGNYFANNREKVWTLGLDTLNVVGLDFGTADMETFVSVRQSREISEYAGEFRQAISQAASSKDLQSELLRLMKKALDYESIARHTTGAFQTIGSAANLGGLIPVIGSITSAVSIGADVAGRSAKKIESKKQWYLIGPKMKEIAVKDALSKL
jgi:hypothetical protein